MRTVFVALFVFLTAGICFAQTETSNSKTTLQIVPSTPQREFAMDQLPPIITDELRQLRTFQAKPDIEPRLVGGTGPQSPCYTMRTFLFSQEPVGSAPRNTAQMTCVPSDKLRVKEAQPDLELPPQ